MRLLEDFAPYFAEFGITAELGGESVQGIFERAYAESFGMATGSPSFWLPSGCVPTGTAAGTDLQLDATAAEALGVSAYWRVRSVEPDGTGITTLTLELAA